MMIFTPKALEQGRKRLEQILNREIPITKKRKKEIIIFWNNEESFSEEQYSPEMIASSRLKEEKELKEGGYLMCVRLRAPEVIGRGEHQLVINVGDGLVAKMNYEMSLNSRERVVQVARKPLSYMHETREELIGLEFNVPPMHFFSMNWVDNAIKVTSGVDHSSYGSNKREFNEFLKTKELNEKSSPRNYWPNIYLTPDLRENGKYMVVDYNAEAARKLVNGNVLVEEFDQRTATLLQFYKNYGEDIEDLNSGKHYLMFNVHKEDPTPKNAAQRAIEKMFFLQVPVDATQLGKLVVGDIDQVYVFR